MKLASLPKAFGIEELKKGYFPHYFNTPANWDYIGDYPHPDYYSIEYMGSDEREKFLKWHGEQKGDFNFREEMHSYCVSDVDILRRSCMKFRQLLLTITGEKKTEVCSETSQIKEIFEHAIDPLSYLTIASVCIGVYRFNYMKELHQVLLQSEKEAAIRENREPVWVEGEKKKLDFYRDGKKLEGVVESKFIKSDVAMIPAGGYVARENFSKDSICWLEWEGKQRGVEIQHALNGGEIRVKSSQGRWYKLDGYYKDPVTQQPIALEYQGCVHHGHYCQPRDAKHPFYKHSMDQRYALTMRKKEELEKAGFRVVMKWECIFKREIALDMELAAFVKNLDVVERLDPRDSFFGGRTNATKLYYKAEEDEKISYVDFTSLYPTVNKYDRYPAGHPTIIEKDFKEMTEYFGIAKLSIVPPRQLYHPVLPCKIGRKLVFPLCRTCATKKSTHECQCTDDQRLLTGTWTTLEINKAVEKGYRIIKVYEVYHWEESTQHDPTVHKGGLFSEYVDAFLKLKQQSSGWPTWCKTEDDKKAYLQQYKEREGIELDPAVIAHNPGMRSLSKLCLNRYDP